MRDSRCLHARGWPVEVSAGARSIATAGFALIGCSDHDPTSAATTTFTVTVQNVLTSGLLVTAGAGVECGSCSAPSWGEIPGRWLAR